jgi:hypothetical protein
LIDRGEEIWYNKNRCSKMKENSDGMIAKEMGI